MARFKYCPQCSNALLTRELNGKHRMACVHCDFVHWNNPTPVAVMLIPHKSGLVLIKRKLAPKAGHWALPSGFVDEGETAEIAAVRESQEETNLTVRLKRLFMQRTTPGNQLLLVYLTYKVRARPAPGDDAEEAKVFGRDEIPEDIAFPVHKEAIKAYFEG